MPWNSPQIRNNYYDFWLCTIPYNPNVRWWYCTNHHFIFDVNVEKQKLYNAQPCIYTDKRFIIEQNVGKFFKHNNGSLKACMRWAKRLGNVPIGTIIEFGKRYYDGSGRLDFGFTFKVRKFNKREFDFEINRPEYFLDFNKYVTGKEHNLLLQLRQNGFIVGIYPNDDDVRGYDVIGYGYGKIFGFSTEKYNFQSYPDGFDSVLWDHFGEFDKWSRCNKIPKSTTNEEIINILINNKNE